MLEENIPFYGTKLTIRSSKLRFPDRQVGFPVKGNFMQDATEGMMMDLFLLESMWASKRSKLYRPIRKKGEEGAPHSRDPPVRLACPTQPTMNKK